MMSPMNDQQSQPPVQQPGEAPFADHPQAGSAQVQPVQYVYVQAAPRQSNSDAIVSMILGILSIVVPFAGFALGIAALCLAATAKNQHNRHKSGTGMADAGIALGIVGLILWGIAGLLWITGLW